MSKQHQDHEERHDKGPLIWFAFLLLTLSIFFGAGALSLFSDTAAGQREEYLPVSLRSPREVNYRADTGPNWSFEADLDLIAYAIRDREPDAADTSARMTEIVQGFLTPVPRVGSDPHIQIPSATSSPEGTLSPQLTASLSSNVEASPTTVDTATPLASPTTSTSPSASPTVAPPPSATSPPGTGCAPGELTIIASKDTWIDKTNATNNYGADASLHVRTTGEFDHRALLRFDLDRIPADCRLTRATLRLHQTTNKRLTINVVRILQTWSEGEVTWDTRPALDPSPWTTFESAGIAPTTIDVDITALVLSWVRGVNPNHGLLLQSINGSGDLLLSSREAADPPSLLVQYSP